VSAEGIRERCRRSLGWPFAPPFISVLRLVGDSVASGEQHGQGLGLGRVQGQGDQRGTELVNAVPGEAPGSECLAQRRADSHGTRPVDGLLLRDGPGACLLSAFEDGSRGHGHHGEDLRALRVKPSEGAGQTSRAAATSSTPMLHCVGSATSASSHAATTACSASASIPPGTVVSFTSHPTMYSELRRARQDPNDGGRLS
jgi:hypothetical protein